MPVRSQYTILDLHGRRVAASLVGAEPGEPGGPWSLRSGRAPRGGSDAVVDAVLAGRHDLEIGDSLEVLGRQFRIVGLSDGTASFMTGFVFVTFDAASGLVRQPDRATAVMIGTDDAATVEQRLEASGLAVLTDDDLRRSGLDLATRVFGTPIRLMVAIAFAAGVLVIALTTYTLVAEHRRDYGIVKAMGATGRDLTAMAAVQTAIVTGTGLVAGLLLFLLGRYLIVTARPQFTVLLTVGSLTRAVLAAIAMGALAAVVPSRRLAKLEPAVAYRSTT